MVSSRWRQRQYSWRSRDVERDGRRWIGRIAGGHAGAASADFGVDRIRRPAKRQGAARPSHSRPALGNPPEGESRHRAVLYVTAKEQRVVRTRLRIIFNLTPLAEPGRTTFDELFMAMMLIAGCDSLAGQQEFESRRSDNGRTGSRTRNRSALAMTFRTRCWCFKPARRSRTPVSRWGIETRRSRCGSIAHHLPDASRREDRLDAQPSATPAQPEAGLTEVRGTC
jgi:hypothetical protein